MVADRLSPRQVVLLPFPFSDLSASKLRPALVMADAGRGDWLLCQITSQPYGDPDAVMLVDADFAHATLVRAIAGQLEESAHERVREALLRLLRR